MQGQLKGSHTLKRLENNFNKIKSASRTTPDQLITYVILLLRLQGINCADQLIPLTAYIQDTY